MYFRMIRRSTTRHIKKFCPELSNEHRAAGVGRKILCVPGVVGSGVIRNSESELPLDGPWGRLGSGGWWIGTSLFSGGRKHVGTPVSGEPGWTPPGWGWEGTCYPPVPGAAGHGLEGSIYPTSGSVRDAEMGCDRCAFEHPLPSLHSPPASWPDRHTALHLWSDRRRGEGRWSYRLPSPDTALCVCPGASLLERIILLFLWCSSEGCNIYQERFLIT